MGIAGQTRDGTEKKRERYGNEEEKDNTGGSQSCRDHQGLAPSYLVS